MLNGNKNTRLSMIFTNSRRIISCYKFNFLELLALKTDLFYNLLMKWRKPVFLKEIKMAKITSKDKVLLIGCGILPSETTLIAEQTKSKIIGIDNSIKACNLAQSYVQKKGLSDLIKIEYGDGANYPLQDFDVIFIAINVWPIDSVLKNLSYNAKANTRIMCKSIKNDIVKSLEKREFHNSFSIGSQIENPKTQSILLIKK